MEVFFFDQGWERSEPELARAMTAHNETVLARAKSEKFLEMARKEV